jgi:hypothetical protein
VGRDREREAHVHAGRVGLDRHVHDGLDLGEGGDVRELPRELAAPHAEDRAAEEDVLAAGELAAEAGADLEQRADAAVDAGASFGRARDPRQ